MVTSTKSLKTKRKPLVWDLDYSRAMRPVLLVDDDVAITLALSAILEVHDIPVAVAGDRESAEALLAEQFFPLVLADLRLRSDGDGLELIEAVRRLSPRTKVAAMTGSATPDIERSARELGAAAVLRKPFPADELLALIGELLDDAGNPQDLGAIYTATTPRLRAMLANRYNIGAADAEDLLQHAWCVLLEKQAEVRDAGAWLAGTVCNLAKQWIERRVRERDLDSVPAAMRIVDCDPTPSLVVRAAMEKLDARSRQLCELIGIERLSYAEASEVLRMPVGSVGPLFIRAKQRLRASL
jgi:CheY-like chemotaxis protein